MGKQVGEGREQGDWSKNFAIVLVRTNQDNDGRNRKQRKDFLDIWLADLIGLGQQLNIENEEGGYLMIKHLL